MKGGICARCECARADHRGFINTGACSCGDCPRFRARGAPVTAIDWWVVVQWKDDGGLPRAVAYGPYPNYGKARAGAESFEDKRRGVRTSTRDVVPRDMPVREIP